ncbi:urease accessory protein UreD, partial [Pseudonocardia pini]|uniref:urease accessory protein UreD n=1 Tax=Pseudonocardia pini TaxID=2758030 RepID=UPI0015EFEFAE
MRARAVLTVERVGERSVVRELRSESPLSLVPRRGTAAAFQSAVTVHLVGSASTPLAGDDVELAVQVGPGAELVLTGVAAAVALPGADRPSTLTMRIEVAEGASVQYLPEPTVITARANHHTLLHATLHETARLRAREILVAGRSGERAGRYRGTTRVEQPSGPLVHQTQDLGDPVLQASPAHLA